MKKALYILLLITIFNSPKIYANDNYSSLSPVIIKSTTNRDEPNTGDYWIAEDLKIGFEKQGLLTDIDYRTEYHRPHTPSPKLSIYMRGYTKFYPPFDEGINLLYVYYPMTYHKDSNQKIKKQILNKRPSMPQNSNLDDDFKNFDIIAVASKSYQEELKKANIDAIYVPQFTNKDKFYPDPKENLKTDILFVGSNWHDRTSLRYAIEEGFEVSVYGYNWKDVIPPHMYKGNYVPNNILNQYYSSAKIVLNDHRPDMKKHGFINNRIYDATASGALVISDYIKEIDDIYKGSVPMYKTKEELKNLLNYYLNNEEIRKELAQKAQEITLKEFTNTAVAKKILSHIKQ